MSNATQGTPLPTVFNFHSHEVRSFLINEQVWFVGTDVARALNYRDAEVACRHLDADEKQVHQLGVPQLNDRGVRLTQTLSGAQELTIINESGLYALVLRSRKPEARKFAKWVTSEVLPAIRKTGSYQSSDTTPSMTNRRWLISFDESGRETVQPIALDVSILNWRNAPKVILSPSVDLRPDLLVEIANACTTRLAQQNDNLLTMNVTLLKKVRGQA